MKKLIAAAAAAASLLAATVAWAQGAQDFRLVNRTGYAITHLQIDSSSDQEWGDDLLGVDILAHGEAADVSFSGDDERCLWDMLVTYEDGDTEDYRQVNLCEISTITLTEDEALAS